MEWHKQRREETQDLSLVFSYWEDEEESENETEE